MKEGGGTLTLSAESEGDWVHLHVGDTGPGIPDRVRPRVFDPFFTTKKAGEGTGLGLSLCYGIITKYGGRIGFLTSSHEDTPDRPSGTTFTVSMRVCEESRSTGLAASRSDGPKTEGVPQ
jgi:signal transduction histidine kinase